MRNLRDWFFELQRKIGTQRRYQVAFGLCLLGMFIIAASVVLDEHIGPHLIWIVISELGIACLIAAIAEFILLEHAKKIFLDEVRQDNNIVRHCLEHKLLDVMPPSREKLNLSLQDIKPTVKGERSEVRVIAFTLQDILPDDTCLRELVKRQMDKDEKVTLKLLLVDPTSPAAKMRVIAEEGPQINFSGSRLRSLLLLSIDAIQKLRKTARDLKKFKIEAGFCNVLPSFYMISTPNDLFIEPYHLGYERDGHPAPVRRAPLLRFSSKSEMYESAKLHFQYLWNHFEHGSTSASQIYVKDIDEVDRRKARRTSKTVPPGAEGNLAPERRQQEGSRAA